MNIPSNSTLNNYFNTVKYNLWTVLSPLQKKVALVALVVFTGLVVFFVNYYFKVKERTAQIPKRLEKNRKFAEAQQAQEQPKGFILDENLSLTHPAFKVEGSAVSVNGKLVGQASSIGRRREMEDEHIIEQFAITIKGQQHIIKMLGVCDGHGGADASAYVKKNIITYMTRALEAHNQRGLTEEGIFNALKSCFKNLDQDYTGPDGEIPKDGTTAAVALTIEESVWIANVGDSRVVFVDEEGVATQVTEDMKPNIDRYLRKILRLGGWVSNLTGEYPGPARVNATLAVARAIGDKRVVGQEGKRCISPNPKITRYPLKDLEGSYLCVACDGLFEAMTTDELGNAIDKMRNAGDDVEVMARRLVTNALITSTDNVSVVIAQF